MLIVLGIYTIASIFEVRHLLRHREKKEAVIYIIISAMTLGLGAYLALTPIFNSFAHIMNALFGVQ